MDQHKVMKLWTAIVTAFLALCTALGLITTTASAAAATEQPETAPKSAPVPAQPTSSWSRAHAQSLPPTMKQRIRAEAHGKTPACRHRPTGDVPSLAADPECLYAPLPARPAIPLQR